MTKETSLVRQAHNLFTAGEYDQAKQLYLQLSQQVGEGLFDANIRLCDARHGIRVDYQIAPSNLTTTPNQEPFKQQLQQTQQLLEHYYQKSQDLLLRNMEQNT